MESDSIPRLEELASACIQKSLKTLNIESKLNLLANIWYITSPTVELIKASLTNSFMDVFPVLRDRYSRESLVDFLGESIYSKLENDYDNVQKDIRYIKSMQGDVVDREIVECHKDEHGCYPYNALKCGVEWPKDVIVTKREQYLSDEEFLTVFKMSKEEFNLKDKLIKLRLKKELGLF